jgi:integrase
VSSIDPWRTGWRARWRDPEGRSRTKVFRRKIDAENHLIAVGHAKLSGAYVDPAQGRTKFADWWVVWQAGRVNLRPSTLARDDSYGRNNVLPYLGKMQLARIDRAFLRAWIAKLSAQGLAPATVRHAALLVSQALGAAVDDRLVPHNPARGLALPRIHQEEMRFLSPDEVAALADTIDPRYRALVLVGAYGGLRLGELGGLRRGRVDLLRRRIDVVENLGEVRGHHVFGPPKTRAGRRSVPIPGTVADVLAEHVHGLGPDDFVFPAPEGGPMRAGLFRRRFWLPGTSAAGVAPLRIHDLRHTAVAMWIAAGASPKEIAVRAGHSSVATVLDRYGHLQPGSEDKVNDALDAMFLAASTVGRGELAAIAG